MTKILGLSLSWLLHCKLTLGKTWWGPNRLVRTFWMEQSLPATGSGWKTTSYDATTAQSKPQSGKGFNCPGSQLLPNSPIRQLPLLLGKEWGQGGKVILRKWYPCGIMKTEKSKFFLHLSPRNMSSISFPLLNVESKWHRSIERLMSHRLKE